MLQMAASREKRKPGRVGQWPEIQSEYGRAILEGKTQTLSLRSGGTSLKHARQHLENVFGFQCEVG